MKTAYLVTGEPGVGKTTLIRQVVSTMRLRASGFYTEDLRSRGVREGFRIVTLDGETALLAATGHPGPVQVSKYGVDVHELERVGVAALQRALERGHILVADEIGKMQLYSHAFRQTILTAVRSGHPVLGTIMAGRNPYADRIKAHRNVEIVTLDEANRGDVLALLRARFV
ncbi:MAG: AAA family ATPase [Chloroflexi bacterium]|nr:AAA family ATPase [Chloroflexota bacterium]